jgi:hypothetical protein
MNSCPCCSDVLLRHIRGHEVYWFCRNCWQSMPVLSVNRSNFASRVTNRELSLVTEGKYKRSDNYLAA